ncbi:hypothetical protein Pla123a_36890 [Posidoniimonas polymericola]|uniref:DUF218 domain-containing protein n=1 Tax=Posidoniimonas polymericola TaxID=2528002 RepID=A0A5C5YH13_9BACT|nr:YdcF family protein [Posidoniimonas polymericola]TWT73795.1 hypothetical protein Pla123a_36890 [Posidoniimonas polymericola]
MNSRVITAAQQLWNYYAAGRSRGPCDAVVVCCSYDLRVCDYACGLINDGLAPLLVLSGNTGNWTRHLWSRPEADVFRDQAIENGIDPQCIRLEREATNFGENITFAKRLLPELRRVTLITKPNSVLRVRLTAQAQWPAVTAFVDSPPLHFPADASQIVGVLGTIDEMVGDYERIVEYPARGYQAPHVFPDAITTAWRSLVAAGFTNHLMQRPAD